MSDLKSALMGAQNTSGIATVRDCGLQGMITLRGDLADAKLAKAVADVTGAEMPAPRKISFAGDKAVAWMSPDELLLLVPYAEATEAVAQIDAALKGTHFMAVNVSDARALFAVEGTAAREVLAKLAPVDLSPKAFAAGDIRRSRLAQIAGAMWMQADGSFRVICFRSVAQYAFDLLSVAAAPNSEVGVYA